MSNPNQIHIVKGRIRAYNYCGVQEFLRQGALYFLPHEEFTIYDEIRMREFALCDDRISIRARDKSGLFRTRRIHIRFLENLRIETLANPSEKTIKYLDDHKIFYYQLDTRKYRHIQETLKHISEYKYEYPVSLKIDDELFKQACKFVTDLQKAIAENDLRRSNRLFFKDSVSIIFTKNNRKQRKFINTDEMLKMMDEIFNQRTKDLILNTDLESIYPCGRSLIIGNLRITMSKQYEFRICEIQKLKPISLK